MKESKPRFMLTRVYGDRTQDEPEIVPLVQAINEAKMNRRGFFGAGITGAAALMILDGCGKDEPELNLEKGDCPGIYAHSDTVCVLAVSPDGKYLFSGSYDKTIKIWSLPSGALIKTLTGHNYEVSELAVSPDSKYLSSSCLDAIKIWSLPNGTLVKTLTVLTRSPLVVSPDGKYLFSCTGEIDIRSLPDLVYIKTLYIQSPKGIMTLAISPDGKYLFSGRSDGSLNIWSLPDGEVVNTVAAHEEGLYALAVSPDGKYLFSGGFDKTIKIWSIPNVELVKTLTGHTSGIFALIVSSDGKYLFSVSKDNTVKIWRLPDGELLNTLTGQTNSLAISPNGQQLFVGLIDGSIKALSLSGSNATLDKCLMDLECSYDTASGLTYSIKDETGQTVTYTLPCGSPIPAGATCACNCVPGKLSCTCLSHCTCQSQCSCDTYGCSCVPVCICMAV